MPKDKKGMTSRAKATDTLFVEVALPSTDVTSGTRLVEIGNPEESMERKAVQIAKGALADSLGVLRLLADAVRSNFLDFPAGDRPMQAEVKLALDFSSETNVWVVKASGKGTLEVKIAVPIGGS